MGTNNVSFRTFSDHLLRTVMLPRGFYLHENTVFDMIVSRFGWISTKDSKCLAAKAELFLVWTPVK